MTNSKKKTVKAWAVVDKEIWEKDGMAFGKIFSQSTGNFSEAIWAESFKDRAEEYAKRLGRGYKTFVVPCTITYSLPPKSK